MGEKGWSGGNYTLTTFLLRLLLRQGVEIAACPTSEPRMIGFSRTGAVMTEGIRIGNLPGDTHTLGLFMYRTHSVENTLIILAPVIRSASAQAQLLLL